MAEPGPDHASTAWREAVQRARDAERTGTGTGARKADRRPSIQPAEWEEVDDAGGIEDEALGAVDRARAAVDRPATTTTRSGSAGDEGARPGGRAAGVPGPVREELEREVGADRIERFGRRLGEASKAFDAERYGDALRILRRLSDVAPRAPAVRELHGLTLYRLGRWRPAIRELEAFRDLTGSTEQHPVLADAYRAVNRHDMVEELWDELRSASPSAPLVTEGRIVMAGSQADRGEAQQAVRTLEQGFTLPKRPADHHLRRAYALADAYERAGDVVRARELFGRVAAHDPTFADAAKRSRVLR